jgi:UDP:flavonoid glycosyltransferase YjiC (YdhE family)
VLLPDEVTPERVKKAVRSVLEEASYVAAACSLGAEIAAMPNPEEVAHALRREFGGMGGQ